MFLFLRLLVSEAALLLYRFRVLRQEYVLDEFQNVSEVFLVFPDGHGARRQLRLLLWPITDLLGQLIEIWSANS